MYWMYQGRFHSKHVSCTAFQHSNRSLCGTDPPTSSSLHIQLWDIPRSIPIGKSKGLEVILSILFCCKRIPNPWKCHQESSAAMLGLGFLWWLSPSPVSKQTRCWKFRKTLIQVINHQPCSVLLQNRFGIRPLHEFIIGAIKTPKVATKSGTQSWLVPHVGQLLQDHPANDLLEKLKRIGP